MTVSEKIKAIDNKTEQNEGQYNLNRQTAKILALSSTNVTKYAILTDKDVFLEKDLLRRSAKIKRFEYSALAGSILEKKSNFLEKGQKKGKIFKTLSKNVQNSKKF